MDRSPYISMETRADFASSAVALLQSTSRALILITGSTFLVWYTVVEGSDPGRLGINFLFLAAGIALVCGLSLWLLTKSFLAAQIVWQMGIVAFITTLGYVSQRAEVMSFYMLLPLMATIMVDWRAGVLMEGVVITLTWWLSRSPVMPHLSPVQTLVIIIGAALGGTFGWVITRSLLTVAEWSLLGFEQARRKMEEARDQQAELKQVREDLMLANRELIRLSERLEAMHQAAEQARQAKEQFVANISHELRTPLNMIIGFSEMITQSPQIYGSDLPASLLADIDVIQRNSRQLARLVDDVLDLSQLEANRVALSREWVSLGNVIDEAAMAVRPLFESRGLYLKTEIPSELPAVFCDSTRIRQVVLNLLSNASRFTEEGGVYVRAWCEENAIVVSVADTGPGIPPEDQQRLFEPFQQLDASIRRRHGGSGLGLSISKKFVEMHEGKMWLESKAGAGTTFYFSLPLGMPASDIMVVSDARRWFSPYSDYGYKIRTRPSKAPKLDVLPRVVILEKGDTLQRLVGRYWDGSEIVAVRDGEAAMHELERSPAQVLIVNTSPFEGMPLSPSQLTALPYDTPAVICWVPGDDDAARRLGVVRYLVKPIAREALLATLEDLDVESVLVVDDDWETLQLFARMLSTAQRKYCVLQASSGQRALSLLRERRPDILLLDLIMPEMDGFTVLQHKSQDPSIQDIPVVVITSRDPANTPIMSNGLTVTCGRGLSVSNLLACIQAVSEILCPAVRRVGRGQPERPAE